MELEIYVDGASSGNPGPSGIGVVILHQGQTIKNMSQFIGNATNNVAEYSALILALEEANILKAQILDIKTDSQLLYRQLNRTYKVKNPDILKLYNRARQLLNLFEKVSLCHIPRENNRGADKLATKAIKNHLKNVRLK